MNAKFNNLYAILMVMRVRGRRGRGVNGVEYSWGLMKMGINPDLDYKLIGN